jgi:hypothetical protein
MAWDPELVKNLQAALAAALDQVPGVSGTVRVECSTAVADLGTATITVNVPDSTASSS